MRSSAIEELDRATLALLQALAEHGEELVPHLDPGYLERLKAELTAWRRALLGVEMGPLYWDMPAEDEDEIDATATQAEP